MQLKLRRIENSMGSSRGTWAVKGMPGVYLLRAGQGWIVSYLPNDEKRSPENLAQFFAGQATGSPKQSFQTRAQALVWLEATASRNQASRIGEALCS